MLNINHMHFHVYLFFNLIKNTIGDEISYKREGLAVNVEEDYKISLLRQKQINRNPSHVLMHCNTKDHKSMLINCKIPQEDKDRKDLSKRGFEDVAMLFDWLSYIKRNPKSQGISDKDYGSHQYILNFVNTSNDRDIGEVMLREYENRHCNKNKLSTRTGLTKKSLEAVNLSFCKAVVKSLSTSCLPHPLGFIRIDAVRGARTTPHIDNIRGPTVNLVNFSSATVNHVNARIMVKYFPAFCTSVVELHGNLFIPFKYTEVEDSLILIGPGKSKKASFLEIVKIFVRTHHPLALLQHSLNSMQQPFMIWFHMDFSILLSLA